MALKFQNPNFDISQNDILEQPKVTEREAD